MFAFLKNRTFLVLLGLLLIAAFIWYAGPYFAFAEIRPLESARSRLIAIGIVLALWFLRVLLRQVRAGSASDKLAKAVVAQLTNAKAGPALHADAARLRERFEEAIAALKKDRRAGRSLYDLPWYVIIGPPGSGKTTALANSGLRFPMEQRFGRDAVRGVGGTRNCDWWLTDQAVFLDTAGRYTTQDSDQAADSAGWSEFLDLLRKYRKLRPVNGVLLAISAADLITQSEAEREATISAVRHRLDELNRHFRIRLPVYVLVTKCDLVAGFTEFFDDLNQEDRGQVWGVSFPYESTQKSQAVEGFAAEFDALIERLNGRLFARLEQERDVRRRVALYAFPQQMAALREPAARFVQDVFSEGRFDHPVLLRGVYFTSGTQEGTPIDRLMGAIGRTFALAPQTVAPAASGRGKAYFIERLLKDVVFAESGLAGVNRRLEVQKGALQLGAYAAMVTVAALGIVALSISFSRNRSFLSDVTRALEQFAAVPAPAVGAPLEDIAARLDALHAVVDTVDARRTGANWSMRAGLYQPGSVGRAAEDAYLRELNRLLLPGVAADLKERLIGYTAEPEKLYEYLKAYLMFGQPEHMDRPVLEYLVNLTLKEDFAGRPDVQQSLSIHLAGLLKQHEGLRPLPLDETLVAQARSTIRQASLAQLMYSRVKLDHVDDTAHALRLDEAIGLGADRVLSRKSGTSLAEPIPSLYTRAVFDQIASMAAVDLAKQFMQDAWVLGEEGFDLAESARLSSEVIEIYEKDYIRAWDEILSDIQLVPFQGLERASELLGILSGSTSPLRNLLVTVDAQTNLTKPKDDAAKEGKVAATVKATQDRLDKLLGAGKKAAGIPQGPAPGSLVTAHFAPLHKLVAGAPGQMPIDVVLNKLGEMQRQMSAVGPKVGEKDPLDALVEAGSGETIKAVEQEARHLPSPVGGLVSQVVGRSGATAVGQARNELQNRYQQQVVRPCAEVLNGRYPFDPTSKVDVPLADFGRLFGAGGVFETFFKTNLERLVDTSRSPWMWRAAESGSLGASRSMLRQFEMAKAIGDMFFRPGGQLPEVRFNLSPAYLDASVTRFVLELDGQNFEYRHGPERRWAAVWPGPASGAAAVAFEDRSGGRPNATFQGPWAWYRLLDTASLQPESDVRYLATVRLGGQEARLVLEATSVRNPHRSAEWRRFRCGGD